MLEISKLPRDPAQALEAVLVNMVRQYSGIDITIRELRDKRHPLYLDIITNHTISVKCAQRLADESIRELAIEFLEYKLDDKLNIVAVRSNKILEAVIAFGLDNHFFPIEEIATYDRAKLTKNEKDEIRDLLAQARRLTLASNDLAEAHKRRVNFRISQVENELYKELSTFGTMMAAAYDVSALIRRVGGDARPIAEAIEKARTITEKKVIGYQQIEADEKPKSLPKPDTE